VLSAGPEAGPARSNNVSAFVVRDLFLVGWVEASASGRLSRVGASDGGGVFEQLADRPLVACVLAVLDGYDLPAGVEAGRAARSC
jgi:hypothetical protein